MISQKIESTKKPKLPLIPLFFERCALFRQRPYAFWLLCAAAMAVLSGAIYMLSHSESLVYLCIPLVFGSLIVPLAIRVARTAVMKWGENLELFVMDVEVVEWFKCQTLAFCAIKPMLAFGALISCVGNITYGFAGAFDQCSLSVTLLLISVIGSAGFMAAIGILSLWYLARLFWRAGRFSIRVDSHPFGVLSTGSTLLYCYFIGAIVWAIFTSSSIVQLSRSWIPVIVIALPTIIFFIMSFVICQIPLHNRMIEYKRSQVLNARNALDELTSKISSDFSPQHKLLLSYHQNRLKQVLALPNWPFDWRGLVGVGFSGLTAALPVIFKFAVPFVTTAIGSSPIAP